jgi:hypothetical protein
MQCSNVKRAKTLPQDCKSSQLICKVERKMMWRSKMQSFAITGNNLVSFGNHGHVCLRDVCRSILSSIALALERACWTKEAPLLKTAIFGCDPRRE